MDGVREGATALETEAPNKFVNQEGLTISPPPWHKCHPQK